MTDKEKGFLSRWSRRKLDEAAKAEAEPEAPGETETIEAQQVEAARVEAEITEAEANRLAAEAIDLETLTFESDFKVFLKRGVPEALRRTALRKFFNSNPLLANLDGLNDYDEDYNNPAHKVYKSSWDVARGFLTKAEELAQKATGRISTAHEEKTATEGPSTDEVVDDVIPQEPPVDDPQSATAELVEPEPADVPKSQRVSIRRRLAG